MAACFDAGCVVYWLLPTAPPWFAGQEGELPPVRRIMAEAGEKFWGRLWQPLYSSLQGNPFAAMPSLHFGTSAMAARLLSQVGPRHGAVGWAYALTLGFGLVYLGEHYVVDLLAGLALSEALWRAAPRLGPAARAVGGVIQRLEPRGRVMSDLREHEDADLELHRAEEDEHADELEGGALQALLQDRRKLFSGLLVLILIIAAIYLVFPKLVGLDDAMDRFDEATWYWIVVAVGFNVVAFMAYVALFRGVLGGVNDSDLRRRLDWRASYQITMAGLAATRIFSAAGAGGIVLTYWALRKAGMSRRRSACRMVAFLTLTYGVYLAALVTFGILLRTGVLPGDAPFGGTVVPAAVAGGLMAVFALIALIPEDVERRIASFAGGYRRKRHLQRLATGPATLASGVRTATAYVRHPRRGALAVVGAVGFWAANIGVLWAAFEAFGGNVPFAVLVQGFFVGMAANLIPSPAGGVGSVDAGMIGAFVLFGISSSVVFPAVLVYRVIAFWLPIPPGIVAYFQLRATATRWDEERKLGRASSVYTSESKVSA